MESHQSVIPLSSSNDFASVSYLCISTTNLWVHTQHLNLTFPMFRLHFISTYWIHHKNVGLLAMRLYNAHSASWTGYDLSIQFREIKVNLLSFHCTIISQPFIVYCQSLLPFCVVMKLYCCLNSDTSFMWSMIYSNKTCMFTSTPTWVNIFSAIAFEASDDLCLSIYSISYMRVSKMKWSLDFPILIPSLSLKCLVTLENSGPSLSLGIERFMFNYVS